MLRSFEAISITTHCTRLPTLQTVWGTSYLTSRHRFSGTGADSSIKSSMRSVTAGTLDKIAPVVTWLKYRMTHILCSIDSCLSKY